MAAVKGGTNGERQGTVPYAADTTGRGNEIVVVESAPGAVLGPDGHFHPLETDGSGNLKTANPAGVSATEDSVRLLRAIAWGIAELTTYGSLDELLDASADSGE